MHDSHITRELYQIARTRPVWSVAEFAEHAAVPPSEVEDSLRYLERLGLLTPSHRSTSGYRANSPELALSRIFAAEAERHSEYEKQIARTREVIGALTEEFLHLSSSPSGGIHVEDLRGADQTNAFLDDAAHRVSRSAYLMYQGGIPSERAIDDMYLRDKAAMSKGVEIRFLYANFVATADHVKNYLRDVAKEGADVRVTSSLPLNLAIFDTEKVLVFGGPEGEISIAAAISAESMAKTFQAIFDFFWTTAEPIDTYSERSFAALTPQMEAIVRMFAEGVKDETIARRLGVSVRTLSRITATLLDRLNVETRFQAGMKIAQLDLLDNGLHKSWKS
ncbi:hypothetical protein ACH4Y0_08155 [Streptomyces sp. NPDC020707]|uniref:hypothetical protein n=1 Tax=Streptomyces sp. NPDC020707 TaxID=3365084 RepID=UPI00379454E7